VVDETRQHPSLGKGVQTFRGTPASYIVGIVFTVSGFLFTGAILYHGLTEGIMVNDVLTKDVGVIVGWSLFLSIFWILGLVILLHVHVHRCEVTSEELRIFDSLNRKCFEARFADVTLYEREENPKDPNRWRLIAGERSTLIPVFALPNIHRLILTRVGPGVIAGGPRPEPPRIALEPGEESLRDSAALGVMLFSLVWYGFLAAFFILALREPLTLVVFGPFLILMGSLMWIVSAPLWRKFLFGRIRYNEAGVGIRVVNQEDWIPWTDLLLIELNKAPAVEVIIGEGEPRLREQLVLVGRDAVLEVPLDHNASRWVEDFASRYAPATTAFVGFLR
jgi:hypothetical protein